MTNEIITLNEMVTLGNLLNKYYDLLKSERNDELNKNYSVEFKCIRYSIKMEEMKKVSSVGRIIQERIEEMKERECEL